MEGGVILDKIERARTLKEALNNFASEIDSIRDEETNELVYDEYSNKPATKSDIKFLAKSVFYLLDEWENIISKELK